MASRHADSSRSRFDDRGRYSAPRREDRRYAPYSRDDRRDSRRDDRREDRRDDRRDLRRDDRYDSRRDDRRDYHRRSRSPPLRRDRSRERHPDRYRDDRPRTTRERAYDDRERDTRRRDDRRGSYGSHESFDGPRRGSSATPGADVRRSAGDRSDHLSREEKQKREQEKKERDATTEQEAKKARLEKWKQKQAEKMKAKGQVDTPATGPSPVVTAPSTPAASAALTPPTETKQEPAKSKPQKVTVEKPKQKEKPEPFKLDESAAARPLLSKTASKPMSKDASSITSRATAQQPKTNGNISSFGLKAKASDEVTTAKNALLDDDDNTGKRKLQALPDFVPTDGPSPPGGDDDAAMSDIGSDDETTNAQLRDQLEKRREEMTNEDTHMEDAPADDGTQMDADKDIDPLDAFMADLSGAQPMSNTRQGQAMFVDDIEPDMTAVEDEDLLALAAAKKKKKELPKVDHSKVEYEPFRKNFYVEPAEIAQMTNEEVADLRHELEGISVKPNDVPRPVTKWAQMGLLQQTMDVFSAKGYDKPTAIQAQAIPIAESGMDLIGIAKTGSGKTLAFGIPMIRHILDQRPLKTSDGPIVLIMAPTRELSLQIVNELKPFLNASNLKIACAYGGPPISEHISMIKRGGIHVLCATPGRLIDLMQSNSGRVLSFKRTTYVVLDEADRMFDMGFEPQVMRILDNVRPDRQAILFSATFPKNMASVVRKNFHKPVEIIVGGRSVVAPEIDQVIDIVDPSPSEKIAQLLRRLGQLYEKDDNAQVLIFVERQETAEDLLARLMRNGYPAVDTIHGGKDQSDRTDAINNFKRGILPMLIATSVAARGLDVPGLAMVINFDCPTHLEDYVHRCGRTGRAGNKGTAVTFVENPGQERFAVHIAKALGESNLPIPEVLGQMANKFQDKVKSGEEKWFSGFGGKGLDKLDNARAAERKREKRALKIDGVDNDSDEEEELPVTKNAEEAPASGSTAPSASADTNDQPAYMKLLSSKIVVNKTERATAGPSKPMSAIEKAKQAANRVDGRLSKKGTIHAGQPIDNKGPDAGLYHSTIEINDFPQKARWAVTNRTNVAKILDSTGVSITTKGTYYPQGKTPGENDQPKLYILVEGDTENAVTSAMIELTRHLREGTMAAEESSARGPTGRYSVI